MTSMYEAMICKLCGTRAFMPYTVVDGKRQRPNYVIEARQRGWILLHGNQPICDKCAHAIAVAFSHLGEADPMRETASPEEAGAGALPRGDFPP